MDDNDFEINGEKMLKSMANAEKYLEKALELDNEGLRKKIEVMSKIFNKFIEKPNKKMFKKLAKKIGLPLEMFLIGLSTSSILFKEALDFDDNELREFIKLYIKSGKEGITFLFGAEK